MAPTARTLWIGTYPAAGQGADTGRGEGIWQVDVDTGTGRLSAPRQVVETAAPSFLAFGDDPHALYAVNEAVDGALTTLRLTSDGAEVAATVPTGGSHPCHVLVDPVLSVVVVANYTSGSISVLDTSGGTGGARPTFVLGFDGSGPHPDRQASSHAHMILAAPGGTHLLAVDLGGDVIRRFVRDVPGRTLVEDGVAVRLPAGSGPRHAAFSPDERHLYVTGELDGQLHTIEWHREEVSGTVVSSVPASANSGAAALAHLSVTEDEVAVGVRGPGALARHRRLPDGRTRFVNEIPLPGASPRHHTIVDGWIVVALQDSHRVCVLDRRGTVVDTAEIPSPACVVAQPDEDERERQ